MLIKAIHRMFFGSLVTIITNLPPAAYKASRSRRLFVSNLLHFILIYDVINQENGSWLITEYYAFTIRVDQVNFLLEKFGVLA